MEKRKVGFRVLKQRVLRFHGQYENSETGTTSVFVRMLLLTTIHGKSGRGFLGSTYGGNGMLTWSWEESTPSLLTLGVLTASHI